MSIVPNNYEFSLEDLLQKSYQSCAAIALLYQTKNGEAVDDENENQNTKYWMAREGVPVDV